MIAAEEVLLEPDADDLARGGAALLSVSAGIMDVMQLGRHLLDFSASNILSPEQVRTGLVTMILGLGGLVPALGTLNELLIKLREREARPSGARSLNS